MLTGRAAADNTDVLMTEPRIEILPEKSSLLPSDARARFVLRITPPSAPERERPPTRLVLALDTSASMAGEPLASAVLTARGVARSLSSRDELGIVTFADRAAALAPMQAMSPAGIAAIEGLVSRLQAQGNTDLASATLSALDLAESGDRQGHILLLTDGRPTYGITHRQEIVRLAKARATRSTLSTFGFGRGVDAELLSDLADAGRGHYAFIETGETPAEAIGAELGGLLATVALAVEVEIEAGKGVTIDAIGRAAGYATIREGHVVLHLAPLVADEAVFVAFRLSWDKGGSGSTKATVRFRARDAADGHAIDQKVPVVPVFAETPGKQVRDAVHALFLSDAADLLATPLEDQAADPALVIAGLRRRASEAGIADDGQIAAAIAMVAHVLESAADARVQQDRVAARRAVYTRKETMTGVTGCESSRVFAAKSQIAGVARIHQSIPPPGAGSSSGTASADAAKEGPHTLLARIFGRNKRPIGQG
jgi:uncharacterized protein YegL